MLELDVSASDADGASTVSLKPGLTATGRQSRARGATPRELADMLAKLLGGSSILLAMWIDVEEAALAPGEADAISEPLARIISRSQWGKKAAKHLLGADDYVALALALGSYTLRIYPLIAARVSQNRVIRPTAEPVRKAQPAAAQHSQQPVQPPVQPGQDLGDVSANGHIKFSGVAGFGAEAS